MNENNKISAFLESASIIPDPSAERIRKRMAELRDMGLEDIPKYAGVTSSMRCFAQMSIAAEDIKDEEEKAFVTTDEKMLKMAKVLEERYHIKVIDFESIKEDMFKAIEGKDTDIKLTSTPSQIKLVKKMIEELE